MTLGHSPFATNLIDSDFGEINIINKPWDSIFEVRASNVYWEGYPFADTAIVQSKKQIVNKEEVGNNYITFDIKAKNWPVTISWDSTLFHGLGDTIQFAGTWMTAWQYGLWWWDEGMQPIYFWKQNKMLLYNELFVYNLNNTLVDYYITNNNDTIYTMWFNFADSTALTLSTENEKKLKEIVIYPNPFENSFNLPEDISPSKIQIRDIKGSKIEFEQKGNSINLINCNPGVYFISFTLNNQLYNYKIIKQ
ncbi:MAG: T9SS type A sorting domain-containing protein [Brumimicrobium sp.]|nr:T9SS type A sorting domain-containing protein [Brumimicrobium sp.]